MPRRALACVIAVVILGFLGYHYLRTTLRKEVQKQDHRVEAQAEFIKGQEQRIASQQQQIASLQQQIQTQDEAMQRRVTRLERQLRANEQKAEEVAEAQPPGPGTLRIYPSAGYLHMRGNTGWCGPGTAQPCDVYELGKEVQIGAALANPSDKPVSYRYINWWPSTFIEVRDQSGHLVRETKELRDLKAKWFRNGDWTGPPVARNQWHEGPSPEDVAVLPPHIASGQGGSVGWGIQVTKHCEISRPGKYSIVAKVRSFYPTEKWVESNKIWVTITAKQSNE